MKGVLTKLLRKNVDTGRIDRFTHPVGAPLVSHLMYADDLLIFVNGGKNLLSGLWRFLLLMKGGWVNKLAMRNR